MITFLVILEIFIAILLIVVILMQSGKGSELGMSFGAGASQTLFGGAGAGNFLTKTTAVLATLFFAIAFTISMLISKQRSGSIFSHTPAPITAPAKKGNSQPQATTTPNTEPPQTATPSNTSNQPIQNKKPVKEEGK